MDTEPVAKVEDAETGAPPAVDAPPSELATLAARARDSPLDWALFNALLTSADKDGQIVAVREAYDLFLSRFPGCFGFWKKWADHELKRSVVLDAAATTEPAAEPPLAPPEAVRNAIAVYERATAAVAHSVEIWAAYAAFLLAQHAAQRQAGALPDAALDAQSPGAAWTGLVTALDVQRCVALARMSRAP